MKGYGTVRQEMFASDPKRTTLTSAELLTITRRNSVRVCDALYANIAAEGAISLESWRL